MRDDLKERHKQILDFNARGVQRTVIEKRCGLTRSQVRYVLDKARADGDARAARKPIAANRAGCLGVPRDLAQAFRDAAAARGLKPEELRARILDVVTRDNLFDALEIAPPKKARRH
ncbi:hypothetical protein [Methylocystis parvus]|uniref:hypothetical protein n=1 Tax=Methylocystis parvus TaxID=134 RepID=UPI003C70716E